MTTTPNVPAQPADAALLRGVCNHAGPDGQVFLMPDDVARLRALADVLERGEQKCEQCGLPHMVDTSLPSDIWNSIAQPHEMLCPLCIDERLVRAGIRAQAKLYCVGEALSGHPYAP